MMKNRLYYSDAYTHQFQANVIETVSENDSHPSKGVSCFAIILNQTYCYPTSGGQPHDTGTINGIPFYNVTVRETDGAILHWVDKNNFSEGQVDVIINWERRFDHMQQHSGQHILSQSFLQVAEAATVGFHLSDNSITIDLDSSTVTDDQLHQVEQLANQVIWQNHPIQTQMVTLEKAKKLPLRKIPPVQQEKLRLVAIGEFDLSACGGTHVAATGAVGLLKLLKAERQKHKTRIEFCCGGRALQEFGQKHQVVSGLTAVLTTGTNHIIPMVERLQDENKQQRRQLKNQQATLLKLEAVQLHQATPIESDGRRVIIHILQDGNAGMMRQLAQHLTQHPNTIAFLGIIGVKTQLLFARSEDAAGDMNRLIKEAVASLEAGSGGGRPTLAQGGGTAVSEATLRQILIQAKMSLWNK